VTTGGISPVEDRTPGPVPASRRVSGGSGSQPPSAPDPAALPAVDPDDRIARVGLAWRELRRGAAMQALRERIYRGEAGSVDLGLADALEVVTLLGPCRMRDLAEALRVEPSTATRTVDRLVEKGLVARVPDPDDARGVLVAPTDRGAQVRARVAEQARAALSEILSAFSDEEQDQLADLLGRLVDSVDRYIEGRPRPVGESTPAGR
jgi:DNA-binding MarR family transcriptional regulator